MDESDPFLLQPAGCFVSLHAMKTRRLRGCVGKLEASQPLLHAVRDAAAAVLEDPRFGEDRVRPEELPGLELEITLLSALRPAPTPLDFDPHHDGIYLVCNKRTGCFLPQVARETRWGRETLLDRLCTEKMKLPACSWRNGDARLYVFGTLIVGPEPFETCSPQRRTERRGSA